MATPNNNPPEVDAETLEIIRRRYTEEAAKRIRPDGLAQFIQLTDTEEERLRALVDDPWVDHDALNTEPSPITEGIIYKYFILGAGFGGLQFAVRLIETGVATAEDIRFVDAAGGFGGTWYWNRFPGSHCDLESYIYLPLLEETGYVPKHRYAPGEEALFRADVKSIEWSDQLQLWNIKGTIRRGPTIGSVPLQTRAQYVYLAPGVLTRLQIPKIPGGSPRYQSLDRLKDKRVAVIGTAATAIGVIPEVAKFAGELYVIQRTPAYVKQRDQRPTDPSKFHTQVANKTGWQNERQRNFDTYLTNSAKAGEANLVGDAWTEMPAYSALLGSPSHGIVDPAPEKLREQATNFHVLNFPHMQSIRSRVDQIVENPEIAAKLKPWYPSWCKRPTFSDTYLQVFNRPNVHLVDTDGQGPSRATPYGLVVGKIEYPLDIIIFGTGYRDPGYGLGSPAARTGIKVIGRDGKSLDDKWQTNGAATLHGYATNGFPTLFFSGASQATVTGNNVMMLDIIAKHVVYMITEAERRVKTDQRAIIEVTKEAEEAHTAEILRRSPFYSSLAGSTPGYFNAHGEAARISVPREKLKRAQGTAWSEGTLSFLDYIQKWKDEGSLKGMSIVAAKK